MKSLPITFSSKWLQNHTLRQAWDDTQKIHATTFIIQNKERENGEKKGKLFTLYYSKMFIFNILNRLKLPTFTLARENKKKPLSGVVSVVHTQTFS